MVKYCMKEEYYTHIAQIDEEHQKLFDIINEVFSLSQNELIPDKYDHIRTILGDLIDYARFHFSHEEEYMKSIGYKGMFMQKVQHDAFMKKIESYDLEEIDEHQQEALSDLLTYLGDWLVNHILEEDKSISQ